MPQTINTEALEKYRDLLDNAMRKYYPDDVMTKYYGRVPLSRYHTFKYCFDAMQGRDDLVIVELGTTRSFRDGSTAQKTKQWSPNEPEVWDWSAGCFTRITSEIIAGANAKIYSIDLSKDALKVSKTVCKDYLSQIEFQHTTSESFLTSFDKPIDLLYLDTGNMDEATAELHLREAEILAQENTLKDDAIILIDDVRNPHMKIQQNEPSDYGKSKYSIPYLVEHGFEILMDEYQVIMRKPA